MTDTRDTPEAALAAALHEIEPYSGNNACEVSYHEDEASALLAAMPNWHLVPADHFDQDADLLAEAIRLHKLSREKGTAR